MGEWSQLPQELQQIILWKVVQNGFIDLIRIGAVCTSWRYDFIKSPTSLYPHIPLLISHYVGEDESKLSLFYMFCVVSNKFYMQDVPAIRTRDCDFLGSSQGWLVMEDLERLTISLINPMTGIEIDLPHLSKKKFDLPPWEKVKIVLSSRPTLSGNENAVVMALCTHTGKLAFCRPDDTTWIAVECGNGGYSDLTYCDGQFYAIDPTGRIVVCDLGPSPRVQEIGTPEGLEPVAPDDYHSLFLVESSEEVLLLTESFWQNAEDDFLYKFKVYKLDRTSQKWLKVKSIGNRTLFLSLNSCYSFLCSNHPGIKGDSIYVITTNPTMNAFILIYDLKDGNLEFLCKEGEFNLEGLDIDGMHWISPTWEK